MAKSVSFPFQGDGAGLFTVISQAFYTGKTPNNLMFGSVINQLPLQVQHNLDYLTRQTDGFNFDEAMGMFSGSKLEEWTYMTRQDRLDPTKYLCDGLYCSIYEKGTERPKREQVPTPNEILYKQLYFLYCLRIEETPHVCTFCPFPNFTTLGNIPVIRHINYRAVTRKIIELPQKDRLGNTHHWVAPSFFSAVFLDLSPTVNGVTQVKLSWVDSRFEHFSKHLLSLLGYQNKPDTGNPTEEEQSEREQEPSLNQFLSSQGLTQREIEVATLLKDGYTDREVSERLVIAEVTVKTHRDRLREKLKKHLSGNEDTKKMLQRLFDGLRG